MKLVKCVNVILIAAFICCLSAGTSFASETLTVITFNSSGKKVKTEEFKYYPKQNMWGFFAVGSDQEQRAKAKDVTVNTPAGILFPGANGTLCINAGDKISPIILASSDGNWTVKVTETSDAYEPLACVEVGLVHITFKVPYMMSYDVQKDMWDFCEEGTQVTRTVSSADVNIFTPVGNMLYFEGSLCISWSEGDWREDVLPMHFFVDPDGNWHITHTLIGG